MNDLLSVLRSGQIALQGLFPWGSNYTFLVTACQAEQQLLAVYKPTKGEQPLWDFPPATLARREVAAYEVSEALGWGFVPPTVLREDGPHGPCSVQLFVQADPELHYFTLPDEEKERMGQVVVFDVLLNNADRKSGHVMKDQGGKIWLIDHGVCFHSDPKLRTVIWELAGAPLPKDILADLQRFRPMLEDGAALAERLGDLLHPREIRALRRRADRLLENPCYPLPGPGRNFPWPPV
ncbi:MAG: SCO1664 family protein [Chloroflexi bacterium]|nr:SCO1664 family protein [Chloroflexota bacterium]